jgi:hypothetical protein
MRRAAVCRAVWNTACDAVLVGNMKRGMDIFSARPEVGGGGPPARGDNANRAAKGVAKGAADDAAAAAAPASAGSAAAGQVRRGVQGGEAREGPGRGV